MLKEQAEQIFHRTVGAREAKLPRFRIAQRGRHVEDLPNAAFSPDIIEIMNDAMETAVATLPYPVSSAHVRNQQRNDYSTVGRRKTVNSIWPSVSSHQFSTTVM
jgi:hypothetical protein